MTITNQNVVEDSSQYQTAAGVSVDVLFSSFEKFLNREWKDRMGPIISSSLLERMQSLFSSFTLKLEVFFRECLPLMRQPPNESYRRSFQEFAS